MNIEEIREFCCSLPGADEDVKWKKDLTFCVGGKMFAVVAMEAPADTVMSFKCSPERFAELIERTDIAPAPYVGRYGWVGLAEFGALEKDELRLCLRESYDLVFAKLPGRIKDKITSG